MLHTICTWVTSQNFAGEQRQRYSLRFKEVASTAEVEMVPHFPGVNVTRDIKDGDGEPVGMR